MESEDTDLEKRAKKDANYSYGMAQCYSFIKDKEKALDLLEISVSLGFIHYHHLNEYDRTMENIRGEVRFKNLMIKVKHEWENFLV